MEKLSAIRVIVTFNLRDFPLKQLERYGIEALYPDAFIVSLIEEDSETVTQALVNQQKALKNPPQTLTQLLTTLEINKLNRSVERLRLLLNEA